MKRLNCSKLLLIGATVSLAVMGFSNAASAQEGTIMAVVHATDPAAQKPAAYAKYYVRNYFAADSRYDSVELDKFADTDSNQAGAKNIQLASEMVQKGREAYDSLELDDAITSLNQAILKYERNVSFLDSTRPLSDAYIALGAAYILRGEEKTGKKALVKAIHIDPLAKPDPRIFNPTMMEIFNTAQEEAMASARGGVNVVSTPGYAEVHLDGKFIGVTPLSKGDIPSGRHIFQLRQDGYRTFGKVVDLMANTEESISGTMDPTKEAARFRDMYARAVQQINKDGIPDSVRELADYFHVENIFIAEVKLENEMVAMTGAQYNITNGQKVKMAKTTFLFDDEQFEYAVQKFMNDNFSSENLFKEPTTGDESGCNNGVCANGAYCTSDADCQEAITSRPQKKKGSSMPPIKKVISFSLIGGGAAFMAIGGGLWGGAYSKAYNIKKNTGDYFTREIKNMQKSGKSLAVTGDVLFFTGTAAALAGGALLIFWHPEDNKHKPAYGANTRKEHLSLSGSMTPVQGGAFATLQGTF